MPNSPPINSIPTANWKIINPDGTCDRIWYNFFQNLQNTVSKQLPIGTIFANAGAGVPIGALPCDGRAISRATYSLLFTQIGTTWGVGDGVSTFNIPEINDFVRGTNGGAVGTSGGNLNTVLTPAQMPEQIVSVTDPGHTHAFTGTPHTHTITDPGHSHTSEAAASNVSSSLSAGGVTPGNTGTSTTGITIDPATAGGTILSDTTGITATVGNVSPTAVDTVPPYVVIQWMIYTGVGA